MRITIIGAGVAGLTCATEFSERGFDVTVVARSERIGDNSCSWYAGGMLAPWCEGESAEEPVVRLGQQAIDWWDAHVDCVERQGTLVLSHTRDASELRRFSRRTSAYATVDAERIEALEPDLAGRFRQGLFFPGEGHLDPRRALEQLADKLRQRGVRLQLGTNWNEAAADSDLIIDCRGLAAKDMLTDLRGVKGEMLVIRSKEVMLHRPVRLLHPRIPLYIVPRGDGVFMVGATMIESGAGNRISVRSALELLGAAFALDPAFAEAEILEMGVDARPAFPDNLPRIRRRGQTLYVNGLYRHGFLLAPVLARMAVEAVTDPTKTPELMDENYPERQSA
ncbi:thiamine biosynthesis protein thio [Paramesorhizobium deserti]|uniref:Thiamine biosynthesis protein thio n=1 Tax=Paramesorhizobium deserti TaxID=1494590 RepID=A0A135I008_9HYPH|nr:glycine oxidase ThiO [Paramesorhizobium deserti]KXF78777.1 thiamine biosynthesis protein thio [Paramesorhizobium deserti]